MKNHFVSLYPEPRRVKPTKGFYATGATLDAQIPTEWQGALAAELRAVSGQLGAMPAGTTRLSLRRARPVCSSSPQAYELAVRAAGIVLTAASEEGARYGLRTLARILQRHPLPCGLIADWPRIAFRGIQFDLGRVIERPDTITRLLDLYASLNYNRLQLYIENAFVFPSHPKLARPFAWALDQTAAVVEQARQRGILVIPAIQSLGHSGWITSHPDYAELDEGHVDGHPRGVLCPAHPRTLEMLDGMIRDVAPLATAGIIHIGLDESFAIGICPKCAAKRRSMGEGGIFVEHANRVAARVRAAGIRPAMWGDMFYYYPKDVSKLDREMLIFDWYYYVFERYPRIELFNFAEMDTQALWHRHKIESWGCPMSLCTVSMPMNLPSEAIGNAASWALYLEKQTRPGIMVTQWELAPSCVDYAPAIDGAIAGLLWNPRTTDPASLLMNSCRTFFNRPDLAILLEELGRYRLHGHCVRRWLNASTTAGMITYTDPSEDGAIALRIDRISNALGLLSEGAANADLIRSHRTAARWLAYQYRKRSAINEAAPCAVDSRYAEAADLLRPLERESRSLAGECQELWNKNRYPQDPATTPAQLFREAALFAEEIRNLESANRGEPYQGGLAKALVAVHVVNTHPAIPCVSLATSPDGVTYTDRGQCYILEFDSHAAHPTSDERLVYAFAVDHPEDARFIRITAKADGQFSLSGARLHHGARTWHPKAVKAEGRVSGANNILRGGMARMGHPNPKALYYKLLAQGDSGRIFSVEHGSVTMEMASDSSQA